MDSTLRAYLECALWATTDQSDDQGGEPLDANYSISDIHPSAVESSRVDLEDFITANGDLLDASGLDWEQIGHDFFLTRNHHGAGFWDRGLPGDIGTLLTSACRPYGEVWFYVGDDGTIYV